MPNNVVKRERQFLKGPSSRWTEFTHVLQITAEFIRGFRKLHFVGPCITVFGSARFNEEHPYYQRAREFGREIAKSDFDLPTFKNTSKYLFIYLLLYQALATTIFIIGIWKCIWKLIFNQ